MSTPEFQIPIVARGEVIEDYEVVYKGRYGADFICPDPVKYLPKILLESRRDMESLYKLSLDNVVEYLLEFGKQLNADNKHLQWSLSMAEAFNDNPRSMLDGQIFKGSADWFTVETINEMIGTVGRENLDGWAKSVKHTGRISYTRAFGVPTAHVIAGNGPSIAINTFIRNALIRGYAIVKIPSNELGTAVALARTAIDMAPDHPLTKAFTAVYWRGGDENFESKLYHPRNVERIVAWGGFASVKHIAKYVRPGIDLLTFDPKISRVILGDATLSFDADMHEAARRLAADVGHGNQNGCANCRVAYVVCDGTDGGIEKLKQFGQQVFDEIQALPPTISTPALHMTHEFQSKMNGLALLDDEYYVIGGDKRGGVIVSLEGDQVDFADDLKYRTVNLVPVKSIDDVYRFITRDVQSVGVYPESVRDIVKLPLALHGVQRITSLGYMLHYDTKANPHDGHEALREFCTWVFAEDCVTNRAPALWRDPQANVA